MRVIQYTLDEIKNLNEYDFNAFTKEDRLAYQPILEKEPYDWELMDFFYKQYRAERLFRRNLSHFVSKTVFSNDLLDGADFRTPETALLDKEALQSVLKLINAMPEPHRNRMYAYAILGKSYKEIAEQEGVHYSSVFRSVQEGKRRLILSRAS